MNGVRVQDTLNKGRGVFANKDFDLGELIELCDTIFLEKKDAEFISFTTLHYYTFEIDNKNELLVMGLGSFYNHSYTPNAKCLIFPLKYENDYYLMRFEAIKKIRKDEEILINYGGTPDSKKPVGFEVKK